MVTEASRQRILDANANRAAEGLRVVEDYLRFVRDDRRLASWCKQLRHQLANCLEREGAATWSLSRDSQADVGRHTKTDRELSRTTPLDVARANLKRIEQALRSLEEWSKLTSEGARQQFEELRYQTYELEAVLERTLFSDTQLAGQQLYVLIDGGLNEADFVHRVRELVSAGAQMFQLRDKQLDDRQLLERGRQLINLARPAGAIVVVNDRVDLAMALAADGVHLGQEDLPAGVARRMLGPHALIGISTHSLAQARQAVADGASYLGVGPTFDSQTKSFRTLAGLEFVRDVAAEIRLPAFAIGGIDLARLDAVLAAGARRVAVSSAIWNQPSPGAAGRAFLERLAREPQDADQPVVVSREEPLP